MQEQLLPAGHYRFNRMELAGALGDLGTMLPIAIAMILLNGLNALGLFLGIGIVYVLSGIYFRVPVPVQPMKVIGAYAIATAINADQIMAASLLMGLFLLIIGLTGAIDLIRKITPLPVIRGVQLSTGILLISGGVRFIMGTSRYQEVHQAIEPHLLFQSIGIIPVSLVMGIVTALITLLLLNNKRYPAALIVVTGGIAAGLALGARFDLKNSGLGINLPTLFPFGFPEKADFAFALFALAIPQLPMTLGNSVLAHTDLSKKYFGDRASRLTNRKVCVSMALAGFLSFILGGIPVCHGAGGLAAHYRFGSRTAGTNLIIGSIFIILAVLFGNNVVGIFNLLPVSVLGVLLVFSGSQLALTIMDLKGRREFFTAIIMVGITLTSNLAAGFIAGMIIAQLLRWKKLSV